MPPSPDHNGPSDSGPPSTSTRPPKRKSDEPAPQQTRAKRNRYISIACNECKRRKIKCNGQNPCQRCGNLSLECLYAPNCCNGFKESEEFKQMEEHIYVLQKEVNTLFANLSDLRNQIGSNRPSVDGPTYNERSEEQPLPQNLTPNLHVNAIASGSAQDGAQPRTQRPSNGGLNPGDAQSAPPPTDKAVNRRVSETEATGRNDPMAMVWPFQRNVVHASKDPLWAIPKEEALRLCKVWQDEIGQMYPIVNMDRLLRHVNLLYTFMGAASRTGLMQIALPGHDAIHDENTNILKLIMAIAITLEGSRQSELGKRVFACVITHVEARLNESANLKSVQMLALTAMYQAYRNEESVACRFIGLAGRLCAEIGLHRRETYDSLFENEDDRILATKVFWSVFVLDRWWSFAMGVPSALQDRDLDSLLPKPNPSSPFLNTMITLTAISSKAWKPVETPDVPGGAVDIEHINYLDYQIMQWQQSLPDPLQYFRFGHVLEAEPNNRAIHRLRVLLYLQANQTRLIIYKPVLQRPMSVIANLCYAQTAVDVAKDIIRVLNYIHQASELYRIPQTIFNQPLISALTVLFLAVSNAPSHFNDQSRDDFYLALELVRGLSATSQVVKRLRRTIKALKEVGLSLGLNLQDQAVSVTDPHSTAAVAMAGLAGHPVDETTIFGNSRETRPPGDTPSAMADDLTILFEAAGGYSNLVPPSEGTPGVNGYVDNSGEEAMNGNVLSEGLGSEEDLWRMMKDLF